MREIGTIDRENDARALADYLLTLDISTKLVPRSDGSWAVWVHKEDMVGRAREVLDDYARDPSDVRFHSAASTAREIRKKSEKDESAYKKRVRNFRDRWEGPIYHRAPLTFALMLLSIGATALVSMHLDLNPPIFTRLAFSVRTVDDQGFITDHGLKDISNGQVWRLVTPIFLHGGIAHLFFNMMALLAFGERIESRKGFWKLAAFVLITAVASNFGQFLHSGGNFGGMSGVIFAMAGYLWIKGHVDPDDGLMLDQRTTNWMIGWFLLGILAAEFAPPGARGFPYNMANVAHGVGLASGMVAGLLRL